MKALFRIIPSKIMLVRNIGVKQAAQGWPDQLQLVHLINRSCQACPFMKIANFESCSCRATKRGKIGPHQNLTYVLLLLLFFFGNVFTTSFKSFFFFLQLCLYKKDLLFVEKRGQ